MRTHLFSLALIAIVITNANAQKFTPGYYVNSSGDTLKTNLSLRKKNGEIAGLQSEGGKQISKTDLKAIGLNGINYVVRITTVDKSPKGPINAIDTVIMEIMSREKISLLYSIDRHDKSHYFIEGEGGTVDELGLRFLDRGDGKNFQELPSYKDKLKALFPTCKLLYSEIDQAHYTKKNIRFVYEKLYQCRYGSKPKTESAKDAAHDFGLTAGISSTKLAFESVGGGAVASTAKWPVSTSMTGGIFMESKFARVNQFSLRQELIYRSYEQTAKDLSTTPGISIIGRVSASYLKYNLMGRIKLSRNAFQPFLSLGISPALLLSSSSSRTVTTSTQVTDELLGKSKSFEFGFVGGAGLTYHDFGLEARMELSGGLDPERYHMRVNTFYLMLSYRIFEGRDK
jgi:hypothetical protein